MPKPKSNESRNDFISRFMSSKEARKDYPDRQQRIAVAISIWNKRHK